MPLTNKTRANNPGAITILLKPAKHTNAASAMYFMLGFLMGLPNILKKYLLRVLKATSWIFRQNQYYKTEKLKRITHWPLNGQT